MRVGSVGAAGHGLGPWGYAVGCGEARSVRRGFGCLRGEARWVRWGFGCLSGEAALGAGLVRGGAVGAVGMAGMTGRFRGWQLWVSSGGTLCGSGSSCIWAG